jgi:non-canonical (house-cleaning) NTP pyrophosphatase
MGQQYSTLGVSTYEVPPQILEHVLNQKMDLSQACFHSGITSKAKVGAGEGLIGILTRGRIDRNAIHERMH